jgi:hypothetical protein
VDEVALIRDTINDYGPVFIAPLSIQIRRAGVQKKFGGRAGRTRQGGSARGEMQKLSAGKSHNAFPDSRAMVGLPGYHSGLMLAARITFAHISISAAMRVANSFGVLATKS